MRTTGRLQRDRKEEKKTPVWIKANNNYAEMLKVEKKEVRVWQDSSLSKYEVAGKVRKVK